MKKYYTNKIAPLAHEVFSRSVFIFTAICTAFTLAAALETLWNAIFPIIATYQKINIWQASIIIGICFIWVQTERIIIHLKINKNQR